MLTEYQMSNEDHVERETHTDREQISVRNSNDATLSDEMNDETAHKMK